MRTRLMLLVGLLVSVAITSAAYIGLPTEPTLALQDAATPVPTATVVFDASVLAQADFEGFPSQSGTVSLVSITIPPGVATRNFDNSGPTLIFVAGGTMALDAELAVVSQPAGGDGLPQPESPAPGPANGLVVSAGEQVLLPEPGTIRLQNPGETAANLIVVFIEPR
jgi:hypothetical protein